MRLLFKNINKKDIYKFTTGIVLVLLWALFDAVGVYFMRGILQEFEFVSGTTTEHFYVFDHIQNNGVNNALILFAFVFLCFFIGYGFKIFGRIINLKVMYNSVCEIRKQIFIKINNLNVKDNFFLSVSSLVNRTTLDTYVLQDLAYFIPLRGIENTIFLVINFCFCIIISPLMSLVLVVLIPLTIIFLIIFSKKSNKYFKRNYPMVDELNTVVRDNILGSRLVRSFNLKEQEKNNFEKINNLQRKTITKADLLINIVVILVITLTNVGIVLSVLISGYGIYFSKVDLSVKDLLTFISYLYATMWSLFHSFDFAASWNRTRTSINRIYEVLNQKSLVVNESLLPFKFDKSGIEFKNISYKYSKEAKKYILKNVSFKIGKGETVGIIGPTGCGKSTIVDLLTRLVEPLEGQILISNENINKFNINDLRKNMGVVFQEKMLFKGTIASNIRFAKNEATDEEIENVGNIALLSDFINNYDDRYEHVVEERGNNLSGGQKQRLVIARALVRKPSILILDDATSALDNITQFEIFKNIKNNFSDLTCIIISQRINAVRNADRIILLNKGQIEAEGSHEELLMKSDFYQQLFLIQQSYIER